MNEISHPQGIFRPLWLAAAFTLCISFLSTNPVAAERNFVGAKKCKVCHGKELMGDQHAAWRMGPHGQAFTSLYTTRASEIAKRMGLSTAANTSPECLSCHSTADRIDQARAAYEVKREDGVQCESCHGPGHEYRKKKIMSDRKKSEAAGLWRADRDPSICVKCHNADSPTFDENRYTLADGSHAGFDFEQARERIAHPIPEPVKGRYIELEREQKEKARRAKR